MSKALKFRLIFVLGAVLFGLVGYGMLVVEPEPTGNAFFVLGVYPAVLCALVAAEPKRLRIAILIQSVLAGLWIGDLFLKQYLDPTYHLTAVIAVLFGSYLSKRAGNWQKRYVAEGTENKPTSSLPRAQS